MPTRTISVGTSLTSIELHKRRIVLVIKNISTNTLYISDQRDQCNSTNGFPLYQYDAVSLYKIDGENPDAQWFLIASGASSDIRIRERFKP